MLHCLNNLVTYVRPSVRSSVHPSAVRIQSVRPLFLPSIRLSVHSSVRLSVRFVRVSLSIRQSFLLSVRPYVRPSVCPFVRPPSVHRFIRSSVRSSFHSSVRPYIRMSVHPPACPPVRPPVRPTARPSVRPPVRLSVRSPVRPSARPTARPSVRPFVRPSVRPSDRPSIQSEDRLLTALCFPLLIFSRRSKALRPVCNMRPVHSKRRALPAQLASTCLGRTARRVLVAVGAVLEADQVCRSLPRNDDVAMRVVSAITRTPRSPLQSRPLLKPDRF